VIDHRLGIIAKITPVGNPKHFQKIDKRLLCRKAPPPGSDQQCHLELSLSGAARKPSSCSAPRLLVLVVHICSEIVKNCLGHFANVCQVLYGEGSTRRGSAIGVIGTKLVSPPHQQECDEAYGNLAPSHCSKSRPQPISFAIFAKIPISSLVNTIRP
jgi:hypothetical protein